MSKKKYSRREFVKRNSLAGVGAAFTMAVPSSIFAASSKRASTPAILGGDRVRTKGWPGWPIWNPGTDEELLLKVMRSGVWSRRNVVTEFEEKWAETVGAKHCLTTVNGTNALICAVKNLDIGAGDEVITSPFTFIATPLSILQNGAMPVFADIDPETVQIDPDKIEEKITSRTRAIMPVHIYGLPADMDRIMAIARKHNLLVVEDACQAWLAEINNQKVGTIGDAGCFSFQNSKHLPMGEGGAIVSNNEEFMNRARSYHNFGGHNIAGTKLRLAEYQAAIGLAQLKRLDRETTIRNQNADYLRSRMREIPGILPHRLYDNVTRGAYHHFPWRYKKEEFADLPRADFVRALRAEGIPANTGYSAGLNSSPYLNDAFQSKNYQKMYPRRMLDFKRYVEQNQCPLNDQFCSEENVRISQNMLLGNKQDIDDVIKAIEKIQNNAEKIKNQI